VSASTNDLFPSPYSLFHRSIFSNVRILGTSHRVSRHCLKEDSSQVTSTSTPHDSCAIICTTPQLGPRNGLGSQHNNQSTENSNMLSSVVCEAAIGFHLSMKNYGQHCEFCVDGSRRARPDFKHFWTQHLHKCV
jgi:hypothetical protein